MLNYYKWFGICLLRVFPQEFQTLSITHKLDVNTTVYLCLTLKEHWRSSHEDATLLMKQRK